MPGPVASSNSVGGLATPTGIEYVDSEVEEIKAKPKRPFHIKLARGLGWTIIICTALYFFMVGIKVMGSAFQVLTGCESGSLFAFTNNPIAGLMVGILVTVLVQSSSTSTSIVVSLVGAGALTVEQAVPIVMGANIGTTVTSTMVAFAQVGDTDQFERAFSAATLHDMFNLLAVAVFLPLQVATEFISKLAEWIVGEGIATEGEEMVSPLDYIIKPVSDWLIQVNKSVIELSANGDVNCSDIDTIMKGGIFYGKTSDLVAGLSCLAISLFMMIGALLLLVKILNYLLRESSETLLKKALGLNGYINIVIGAGVTFVVQSSSIVTSVLTPLVGVGVVELADMYPLVLGANIGTTGTAFLAALVSANDDAVAIAICHLIFNLCGILLFYPIPFMRRIPIKMATVQGWVGARWKTYPIAYLVSLFIIIPVVLISLSVLYEQGGVYLGIGIGVTVLIVLAIVFFIFWFNWRGGKQKVIDWLEAKHKKDMETGVGNLSNISRLSVVDVQGIIDNYSRNSKNAKTDKV